MAAFQFTSDIYLDKCLNRLFRIREQVFIKPNDELQQSFLKLSAKKVLLNDLLREYDNNCATPVCKIPAKDIKKVEAVQEKVYKPKFVSSLKSSSLLLSPSPYNASDKESANSNISDQLACRNMFEVQDRSGICGEDVEATLIHSLWIYCQK